MGHRCVFECVEVALKHQRVVALHGVVPLVEFLLVLRVFIHIEAYAADDQCNDKRHDDAHLAGLFLGRWGRWGALLRAYGHFVRRGVCFLLLRGCFLSRDIGYGGDGSCGLRACRMIVAMGTPVFVGEIHFAAFRATGHVACYLHPAAGACGCFVAYLMPALRAFDDGHLLFRFIYLAILLILSLCIVIGVGTLAHAGCDGP